MVQINFKVDFVHLSIFHKQLFIFFDEIASWLFVGTGVLVNVVDLD